MRGRSEEGFTLVEVLMAVTIIGILGSAVTASIIIGLRTTDATANRLSDSRDAQLAATYFGTDVQAADEVDVAPAAAPSCKPTLPVPIVTLTDEFLAGGALIESVVSYLVETNPAGTDNLRRIACEATAVTGDVVVASDLAQGTDPVATCPADPSCADKPTQVKMTVSVRGCSATESTCREGVDNSPYAYELVGTTRSVESP